jgi:hypothetical protein
MASRLHSERQEGSTMQHRGTLLRVAARFAAAHLLTAAPLVAFAEDSGCCAAGEVQASSYDHGAAANNSCGEWFPDLQCDFNGRWSGFAMPIASPYLFEEPFITTGLYGYGIWHDFPRSSVFGGGEAWVAALQARLAITDRLAFIATKDGYAFFDPGNDAVFRNSDGFFDISAGFKYALIQLPEKNFILTPSLRIDIPVGNEEVFSGNGDGVLIPAVSSAWGIGRFAAIGDLGGQVPFDGGKESSMLFYHLSLQAALHEHFVPLLELSGYHWTDGGDGTREVDTRLGKLTVSQAQAALGLGSFEGADVVSLGTRDVDGNDLVTLSAGARFPLGCGLTFGAAYEFPITNREDIFHQRVTMTLTFEL